MIATPVQIVQRDRAQLGAHLDPSGACHFSVWAPAVDKLWLRVMGPHEQLIPMRPLARGYFSTAVDGLQAGALYKFRLEDDREVPDPASRSQPEGPHGPSQVVSEEFVWNDEAWRGLALAEHVFYEIHAGTFTPEGTLDAIIPRLDELRDLGITAIELMPVAQFPGARNWGYDGTFPFAVHDSYGGAAALQRLAVLYRERVDVGNGISRRCAAARCHSRHL